MAVDIVPRKATGAAIGVVGIASYLAAGLQDIASGVLIDKNVIVTAGVKHYDFSQAGIFWIAAACISFMLPLLNLFFKKKDDDEEELPQLPTTPSNETAQTAETADNNDPKTQLK